MIPTLESQRAVDEFLGGIAADFQRIDWTPWLNRSLRDIEAEHALMFSEQRAPNQEDWTPLAPSTVKRKGHATILVETGALKASLTQPGRGIREVFQESGNIGLIFGTDVPYSIFHLRGNARLPIRDHVGIPLPRFESLVGTACDHALAELKQ